MENTKKLMEQYEKQEKLLYCYYTLKFTFYLNKFLLFIMIMHEKLSWMNHIFYISKFP